MQFRISPGGSIFMSSRSRPDDPPSSVTVTTAESSRTTHRKEGPGCDADAPPLAALPIRIPRLRSGVGTYRLNPRSSVDSPVPPPIATTRSSFSLDSVEFGNDMHPVSYPSLNEACFSLDAREGLNLGIEQFGKPRIV